MILKPYSSNSPVTHLVTALPVELPTPEWNSHSGVSRLALHPDARVLQRVQLPFPG